MMKTSFLLENEGGDFSGTKATVSSSGSGMSFIRFKSDSRKLTRRAILVSCAYNLFDGVLLSGRVQGIREYSSAIETLLKERLRSSRLYSFHFRSLSSATSTS